MRRVIYRKQYDLAERKAEWMQEDGRVISNRVKELLIDSAVRFSKRYQQGIEIAEEGEEMSIDLYLTDHFFMGDGKAELTRLFIWANRVDLSLGSEDVLINFYFKII